MFSDTAHKSALLSETQQLKPRTSGIALRKIWLPKALYDALPYFYFLAGCAAFLATLYISEWFWVLPHYLLFSAACLHLGVLVYRRRHARRAPPSETKEESSA